MVCSISGKHMMALNAQIEHCSDSCERPTDGETVKRHCCDFESNYFKEDFRTQQKDEQETVTLSAFHFIPVRAFIFEAAQTVEAKLPAFRDLPPPLKVRAHVLHQVFLV
jgi:hypothetical protein